MSEGYFDEKERELLQDETLPITNTPSVAPRQSRWFFKFKTFYNILTCYLIIHTSYRLFLRHRDGPLGLSNWRDSDAPALCPQQEPLAPFAHSKLADELMETYATDEFEKKAIDWLSGAVKIAYVFHLAHLCRPLVG